MPKTSHLSLNELEEFRSRLAQERRMLLDEIRRLEAELSEDSETTNARGELSSLPTHPADFGTDLNQRELSMHLLARGRNKLVEIDNALIRIEDGTYGMCLASGQPISIERLRARPWARYSLEFAQKHGER